MEQVSGLQIVLSILFGGAAGALITVTANERRGRRELALKLLDQYMSRFDEFKEVRSLLRDPASLAVAAAINKVGNLANWFEVAAFCYLEGSADAGIVRAMGLDNLCRTFAKELEDARVQLPTGGTEHAFSQERLEQMEYLTRLKRGCEPSCLSSV